MYNRASYTSAAQRKYLAKKRIDMKRTLCFHRSTKVAKGKLMNVLPYIKKAFGKKQGIKRLGLPIALRAFVL